MNKHEKAEALHARIVELLEAGHSGRQVAAIVGVHHATVHKHWTREEDRRRRNCAEGRFVAIDTAELATCDRCGLRGDHECVPSIWAYAAQRRGEATG